MVALSARHRCCSLKLKTRGLTLKNGCNLSARTPRTTNMVDLPPPSRLLTFRSSRHLSSECASLESHLGSWSCSRSSRGRGLGEKNGEAAADALEWSYLGGEDLLLQLGGVLGLERRSTREHLVRQGTQRPPVHRLTRINSRMNTRHILKVAPANTASQRGSYRVVAFAEQHLRGHVLLGAAHGEEFLVLRCHLAVAIQNHNERFHTGRSAGKARALAPGRTPSRARSR